MGNQNGTFSMFHQNGTFSKYKKISKLILTQMKKLEEILKNRENLLKRYKDYPFSSFYGKITTSLELIAQINIKFDKNYPSFIATFQEALKNFTISLITAMEVYFSDWCRVLIDRYKINFKKFPKDLLPKFTLEEIEFILSEKLKMGEIVAKYGNFQNLNQINKIFSNLLDLKFLDEIKIINIDIRGKNTTFDNKDYIKLEEIIGLRHEFVHDIDLFSSNLEFEESFSFFEVLEKLGMVVDHLILNNLK